MYITPDELERAARAASAIWDRADDQEAGQRWRTAVTAAFEETGFIVRGPHLHEIPPARRHTAEVPGHGPYDMADILPTDAEREIAEHERHTDRDPECALCTLEAAGDSLLHRPSH